MGLSGKLPKCMAGTLWGTLDPPLNFNSMCPSIRPTMPPVHRIPRPQLGDGDRTEWGTPNWTYESLLTRRILQQRGIRKRPSFHPAYPVYVGLTVSLLDVINFDWRTHVLTTKLEMIYVSNIFVLFIRQRRIQGLLRIYLPSGLISFIFMQFSAKNLPNNRFILGLAPSSAKSWIHHCL